MKGYINLSFLLYFTIEKTITSGKDMTYRGNWCCVSTILYQTVCTKCSRDSWFAVKLSAHWIFIGSTSQSMFGSKSVLIVLSNVSCKYCSKTAT